MDENIIGDTITKKLGLKLIIKEFLNIRHRIVRVIILVYHLSFPKCTLKVELLERTYLHSSFLQYLEFFINPKNK